MRSLAEACTANQQPTSMASRFEIFSAVNIKVTDGVIFSFGIHSQLLFGFPGGTLGEDTVFLTDLEQDRAAHFGGMLERPVFVSAQNDTGTGLVDIILGGMFPEKLIGIRGCHQSDTAWLPHYGNFVG